MPADPPSSTGAEAAAPAAAAGGRFDAPTVLLLSGAHFVHDAYPAFTGVMLPLLIDKLGLTIGQAGAMASGIKWTTLLQVVMGYFADKVDSRYLVIAAPAVTAISVSCIGLAPSYFAVFALLLVAGVSHASFHPASASVVTRVSGSRWGRGMSYFMTGGELGRALGPLFIAAVLTAVGLEWAWLALIPGVLASIFLYGRLRGAGTVRFHHPPGAVRESLRKGRRGILPLCVAVVFRSISHNAIATFVPTLAVLNGADIAYAGGAVAAYEVGGTLGAFAGGILSDRWGRKAVLAVGLVGGLPPLAASLFLAPSAAQLLALAIGGFFILSSSAVHLVSMQELMPDNRSLATGIFYFMTTAGAIITMIGIGSLADRTSLRTAMSVAMVLATLALPAILLLPRQLSARGRGRGH
jgi:FSR family fosmidomycin resistance protein-like MFS transporter